MSESEPGDSATPADSASAQDASWVGRVIDGRYRIDQVLDEGGMGAVFIAEHLKLQKSVAFKVILPKLAGDPELAQRFAREGMVSAKLEHPHIASAIDSGTLPDGGAYLVMQLARGRGLRAWMGRGADWRLAARIGMQLADALAAAHAHGIVHRDLKPENVKVEDRDGTLHARVLDFGIARVSEPPSAGGALTRIGSIMGTPGYMAPEQAVGEAVDARADVYALGVILWELATGETLFDQEDFGAITTAQFSSPAPPLRETCPDVPPELDALVARMLEVSKDKRPADGGEVREVLRRVVLAGSIAMPAAREPSAPAALEGARTQGALSTVRAGADSATELAPPATSSGGAPPRAWIAAGLGIGLLALVSLCCVSSRCVCAGSDLGTEAAAPTTEQAPEVDTTPTPAPADGVPPELAADATLLSGAADDASRAAAAARLVPRQAELPAYMRMVLAYATSDDCSERRDAIRGLRALRDPRALPSLYAISDAQRRGDRCLRRDLERTIDTLVRHRLDVPTR